MNRCEKCPKEYENACLDCFSLIDGGVLRQKLERHRKVLLETAEGKQFIGELFMVSPVGLGIKTKIVPSNYHLVKLQDILQVRARLIGNRGIGDYYGFDIVEVIRGENSSHHLNNEEYRALTVPCDQLVNEISEALPEDVRDIVQERLKTELEKARILDSLHVGQTYKFQKDQLKPIASGTGSVPVPIQELMAVVNKCRQKGAHYREVIIDEQDRMFDIHGIPFDYQSGGLLVLDVTPVIEKERELKKKEVLIYREVIGAVTGGKLLVVDREEIPTYMAIGQTVLEKDIIDPQELDGVREKIREILNVQDLSVKEVFMYQVCVSEALTNTLKHAQAGTCRVNVAPDVIRTEISDKGPGINFRDLPKATLMKSFSTQKSLGCGFTLMLQYMDRVILATDPGGTTVILEKKKAHQGKTLPGNSEHGIEVTA